MTQTLQPIVSLGALAPFCPEPVPPDFATELPGTLATSAAAAVPGAPPDRPDTRADCLHRLCCASTLSLKPVIGPPPSSNRWNMAAVGLPPLAFGWRQPTSAGGLGSGIQSPRPPGRRTRQERKNFLMGDGNVVPATAQDCGGHRQSSRGKIPGLRVPVRQAFITRRQLHSHGPDALERELDHQPPDRSHPDDSGIQRSLPVGELQVLIR